MKWYVNAFRISKFENLEMLYYLFRFLEEYGISGSHMLGLHLIPFAVGTDHRRSLSQHGLARSLSSI